MTTSYGKLTSHGNYSAKSAYNAQFLSSTTTNFDTLIWRNWAPASCKLFSWLALQNRLWMVDRLLTRGWPNEATCPICRNQPEIAIHLFANCRFTKKVWASIAQWLAILALHPREWPQHDGDIHTWWASRATSITSSRKGLRSLIMLASWVI